MANVMAVSEGSCFFEVDGSVSLLRRSLVEAVGTCLLTVAMVGSGLAVQEKLSTEPVAGSIVIAISIAGSLVGLIIAMGKVSGGHYNPLITLGQWIRGERATVCTIAYIVAQIAGGIAGAMISSAMSAEATHHMIVEPPGNGLLVSELLSATGLLIVVIGCGRSSRWETGPFAVGAWLTAAILAMPSTSYANPAVTIAAAFANGPVSLDWMAVLSYSVAQVCGLLISILITTAAFGRASNNQLLKNRGASHDQT